MRALWILLLVLACTVFDAACADEPPAAEARYEGKPASHWAAELEKQDVGARRKAVYALLKLGLAAKDAAPRLARSFEDEDAYVRDTAYAALVALEGDARPAVKALRSALNDGRERVRQLALWALLRIDPATAFRDEDFDVRKAALMVIANPNPHNFLNATVFGELVAQAGDEDEEIRSGACTVLGTAYAFHARDRRPYLVTQKVHVAATLLRLAAQDEFVSVRSSAVYALMWLVRYPKGPKLSERILPVLIAATRDEASEVRGWAFRSLGGAEHKSAPIEAAFLLGLKDPNGTVRAAAASHIASVSGGGAPVVSALIGKLDDDDRSMRIAACRALGAFSEKSASAVPALLTLLGDETHVRVRHAIAAALGDIGPPAKGALPQLEAAFKAAKQPDTGVAYALVCLGSERQQAALSRLVEAALSGVGGQEQVWLRELGSAAAPAIPPLIEALTKGKGAVRMEAAWTLLAMGSVAKPAIPALEALTKKDADIDEKLANAARDALEKIRGS